MAIMLRKTTYQVHLHLVPNFRYLLVALFRRTLLSSLYDTMLEYGAPTIVVLKYTNREYFLTNVNTSVQIALEQNLLYFPFFEVQSLFPLKVSFLRTIVS